MDDEKDLMNKDKALGQFAVLILVILVVTIVTLSLILG